MKSSAFIDLALLKRRGITPVADMIAPTDDCPWRKRIMCGEVADENAWAMGGISGHAGLFTNILDLQLWAGELLASYHGRSHFIDSAILKRFWSQPKEIAGFEPRQENGFCYGWDRPSKDNGMLESGLSSEAVGHHSSTGCSVWLEPNQDIGIILLSNRTHPSRSNKKILAFRPEVHQAILQAVSQS
jgi:CubicO group peptidase (beta-lactamase class C family)